MARKRHMEVILCTPTAAPPIWLVQEHPDVLPIDESGKQYRFGGRRHYSPTAPAMLQATIRIVTAMAQHFGDREGVIGWQIDNELGCQFDQNEHAHIAFRRWLQQKYGTIENLTARGGTSSGTRTTRASRRSCCARRAIPVRPIRTTRSTARASGRTRSRTSPRFRRTFSASTSAAASSPPTSCRSTSTSTRRLADDLSLMTLGQLPGHRARVQSAG
jgi:hypothetical protein